jgi:hypothetical protein
MPSTTLSLAGNIADVVHSRKRASSLQVLFFQLLSINLDALNRIGAGGEIINLKACGSAEIDHYGTQPAGSSRSTAVGRE